jgi:hypothetical protein
MRYDSAEGRAADARGRDLPAVVSIDGGEPLMNAQANAPSAPRIRKLFGISYHQ